MVNFYLICWKCGKNVKIDKEKMGNLGGIENRKIRSFDCPYCGSILASVRD